MHRYDNIFGSESDTVGKSENYGQILTTPFEGFFRTLSSAEVGTNDPQLVFRIWLTGTKTNPAVL